MYKNISEDTQEVQPIRGTVRRRDEEQTLTKQHHI